MLLEAAISIALLCTLASCSWLPDAQPESSFFVQDNEKYIVLMASMFGLANRLRAIADWYLVAKESNRKLLVMWTVSEDCGISFSEMFQAGHPDDLHVISWHQMSSQVIVDAAVARNKSVLVMDLHKGSPYLASNATEFVLLRSVTQLPQDVIITTHIALISLKDTPCQYYLAKRAAFLSSLKPVEAASKLVDQLMGEYFSTAVPIAVHIRMHDARYDWAVIPPLSSAIASEFGMGATVDMFVVLMKQVQEHFTITDPLTGESRSLARFLIASNDANVKAHLMNTFGNLAVGLHGNLDRSSAEGMYFAFAEWLAISRCDLVINTHGSTFAQEAAAVRTIPLVGIWEGLPIMSNHPTLPFCGNLPHLEGYAKEHSKYSYTEGTPDSRMVVNKAFRIKASDCLQYLGLSKVYHAVDEQ